MRKAMTGHSNKTTEEISKLMPEDFNKKLREWEQLKVSKPNERFVIIAVTVKVIGAYYDI